MRGMTRALQPAYYAPSSTHGGFKGIALVRRRPLLSSITICSVLVGTVAGIVRWSYGRDTQYAYQQIPLDASGVALIGHSYRLDLTSQMLTVGWDLVGCGAYGLLTYPPADSSYRSAGCDVLNRAVDIYLNGVPTPIFSYDPANFPLTPNGPRYVNSLNVFEVDHRIDFLAPDMAPFDSYIFTASVFVIEKATNKSVPIIAFAAGEAPDNFIVFSSETSTTSNFTFDSGTGPTTTVVEYSVVDMEARRSQLAQAFTMCLFLANWALTIGSVYIALVALVGTEKTDAAVLLLPVTIVLTIPTLRDLYVGSPPFGIYLDTIGLFLQMMTVAASSMILLYLAAVSGPVRTGQASSGGENI